MIYVFLLEPLFYQALGLATLVMALWALSDAVRRKPAAFDAAGKRTKGFWLGLTGGAAAVGILGTLSPGSLLPFILAGLVAASVYLADVKPSIGGSGRGSSGPYGRW